MGTIDDHTAGFEAAFAVLGESATYAGASVTAVVEGGKYSGDGLRLPGRADQATIELLKSEVAAVARRDAVVIGSTTWRVHEILSSDEWCWRVLVVTNERPSI